MADLEPADPGERFGVCRGITELPSNEASTDNVLKITPSTKVEITVGSSIFTVNAGLLMKHSLYFNNLLSERWIHGVKINNDTAYVTLDDMEEDLCLHILTYIRDGIYPLLYSPAVGHDVPGYIHLLQHAQYLGVTGLIAWIKQQKYYEAITHRYRRVCHYEDADTSTAFDHNANSDRTLEFHTIPYNKKVYVCPRGIVVHYGQPQRCGQACDRQKAINGGDTEFEDELVMDVIVVSKETHFDLDKCMEDRSS